jgi:hypothetical protein
VPGDRLAGRSLQPVREWTPGRHGGQYPDHGRQQLRHHCADRHRLHRRVGAGYTGAFVIAGALLLAGIATALALTRQPISADAAAGAKLLVSEPVS